MAMPPPQKRMRLRGKSAAMMQLASKSLRPWRTTGDASQPTRCTTVLNIGLHARSVKLGGTPVSYTHLRAHETRRHL
eukprot:5623576-Prorocentrum_lima.AAC.1